MRKFFSFLVLTSILCGCSNDDSLQTMGEQPIEFRPMVISPTVVGDETTKSRASQATKNDITSFGVSCAIYPSTATYTSAACGSFFFNEEVDASLGTCGYYWPGKEYNLSFYTYAPYGNDYITIASAKTDLGIPTYSYSVPSDLSKQADFMTCDVLDHIGTSTTPIELTFSHRCADIRFSAYNQATDAITLNSISIYGVKYKGTFNNGAWTLESSVNSNSVNPFTLSSSTSIPSETTIDATGTANHFIMLPQTVAKGTEFIVVKTTEEGEEKTYTYTLPNDLTLEMKKSYVFKLTLSYGLLVVDVNSDIKDWEGEMIYLDVDNSDTENFNPSTIDDDNVSNDINDWTL